MIQRDSLHDPSVYVINRKLVLISKSQVFYNDDSLNVYCAPLSTNALKCSESFLGDAMNIDHKCKFEEPLHSITIDFDWPKVALF